MASRRSQTPVDSEDGSFSDSEGSDQESGRRSQTAVDSEDGSFSDSEGSDQESEDESSSSSEQTDHSSDEDSDDVMPRISSSTTSAEMQGSNLSTLQAIINPLEQGLQSFNSMSEILLSIDADIVTSGCRTFDNFRQEVQCMEDHLTESERIACEELEQLDEKTETLTAHKSDLERYRKKQGDKLKELKTILDSYESNLTSCTEARKAEKRNLKFAEKALEEMQDKENHARGLRNAGIGLLAIPVVGWVAGGIMIGVGEADLSSATDGVREACDMYEKCNSQIKKFTKKISHYNEIISKGEKEIKKVNRRIPETEAKLKDLSKKRKTVANLQSHTRRVFHHLGLLSGVGNAVESQTRKQILVETVTKVMHELTPVLTQIIEDRLQPTDGLKILLQEMETNHRQLKTNLSEENSEYY